MTENPIRLTCKLTDQAFPRADAGDDATARDALEDVFAIPSHEMTVVDDVLLAFLQLQTNQSDLNVFISSP